MSITAIYNPSPWQKEFHSLEVYEALGAGSAGPGKTTCLLAEPLAQLFIEDERCRIKQHPHHMTWGSSVGWALFLRRTWPRQQQNIVRAKRLYKAADDSMDWNDKRGMFTFRSGYRIQFGTCKDPGDWEQYYSNEYTLILFDELVEFLWEQYTQITSRLRTTDPVLKQMLKIRAMSNPFQKEYLPRGRDDPHWVRKRFVDPHPAGRKILKKRLTLKDGSKVIRDRIYLPAKLSDNPDPTFVKQYETTLQDKAPHIRKALLDGDWYVTADSFFADAWSPIYHVCKPFKIPDDWLRFRSMDWGFKTPGCVGWFAIDPDGNLFVEREFTFKEMLVKDVARNMREIEIQLGLWIHGKSRINGPADTQLWEERGDRGISKATEFQKLGIKWVPADKARGSRRRDSERIMTRLKDHREGTTTAGLVFFNTCKMCIQTIPAIQSDKDEVEIPAKGGDDHWFDMVRYGVTYASRGQVGRAKSDIHGSRDPDDMEDEEDFEQEERGATGYGL